MAEKKFLCDINLNSNKLKNPAFDNGSIPLAALATDPLARANHTGTQSASTISDFDTQVRTSRLDQMAAPTASVALNSQKITGLASGTANGDAATFGQLLSVQNGTQWKDPVRAVATANITLSGAQTIDGVSVVATDRVLVAGQTDPIENGIYVAASGAWARAADMAAGSDGANASMYVGEGTTNADTQWRCTDNIGSDVVDTDGLAFTQFGAGTSYSADNTTLELTGTTFSIKNAGVAATQLATDAVTTVKITDANVTTAKLADGSVTTAKIADVNVTTAKIADDAVTSAKIADGAVLTAHITDANVTTAKLADDAVTTAKVANGAITDAKLASTFAKKYAENIGDGAETDIVVTHNLGTRDCCISVHDNSSYDEVGCEVSKTSVNTVTLSFATAPTSDQYRVTVIG